MEKKLSFEIVPDGCFKSNLRSFLTKEGWDFIKDFTKQRFNYKCAVCGESNEKLEAHEKWSYNEKTKTQKLEDVVCLCPTCHKAVHMNRTLVAENESVIEKAEEKYMKINGVSYSEMRKDLGKANEIIEQLNKIDEWKVDLTWLKQFVKD